MTKAGKFVTRSHNWPIRLLGTISIITTLWNRFKSICVEPWWRSNGVKSRADRTMMKYYPIRLRRARPFSAFRKCLTIRRATIYTLNITYAHKAHSDIPCFSTILYAASTDESSVWTLIIARQRLKSNIFCYHSLSFYWEFSTINSLFCSDFR